MASGRGSNLQAIIDASAAGVLDAEVVVVISNNREAYALQRAAESGIPGHHLSNRTHPGPGELDLAMADTLQAYGAEWVVLAGYMKKVGPLTLERFPGRILNIHPALLPEFGGEGMYGRRVHQAVLDAGRKVTGVTIHIVDAEYDRGTILARREVPVLQGDSAESLALRVLDEEHRFLVETLGRLASGELGPP